LIFADACPRPALNVYMSSIPVGLVGFGVFFGGTGAVFLASAIFS